VRISICGEDPLHETPLITTVATAFGASLFLGIVTQKLGMSPIVGYLLAGILIGPFTPGFVADAGLASQLAEIGVVLLMFGVGLHFRLKDLLAVRWIAVPGALIQSAVATLLGIVTARAFGWSWSAGLVLGLALAVASTVVLMRVLEDRDLLTSIHGHVAVGWLIVEDVLTVAMLVSLPAFAEATGASKPAGGAVPSLVATLAMAMLKLAALVALVLVVGPRVIPRLLERAARFRSRELFTLTVLTLAVAVAAGSAHFFGASMALGAFLAGMIVGQSAVSQQAAAEALPLRDAFAVLFFVSVGMLFDPAFMVREPGLVLAALAIVLVGKPLAALAVVAALGYSSRTGLTVALGLAQIGEFSFILAELGRQHTLLPDEGASLVVACALVSITVNPLLFHKLDAIDGWLRNHALLGRLLNGRADRRTDGVNRRASRAVEELGQLVVIVGYGPVGRSVDRLLRQAGLKTVVIDMNLDTVNALAGEGRIALYGDASRREILKQAGAERATHLVVTLPHSVNRGPLVAAARQLNPSLQILVRARYLRERRDLEQAGASAACFEEIEAAVALARTLLQEIGTDDHTMQRETEAIRRELASTP
jgi:monovalent cation:H+ antiporter-2, CPA2 family